MRDEPCYNDPGTLQSSPGLLPRYVEVIVRSLRQEPLCCDVNVFKGEIRIMVDSVTQRSKAAALWRP
mgnify:CR=1 FL=1